MILEIRTTMKPCNCTFLLNVHIKLAIVQSRRAECASIEGMGHGAGDRACTKQQEFSSAGTQKGGCQWSLPYSFCSHHCPPTFCLSQASLRGSCLQGCAWPSPCRRLK